MTGDRSEQWREKTDRTAAGAAAPPHDDGAVLRRGARGAAAIGVRQILVQLLNVGGAVALANLLTPAQFGGYAVTLLLVNLLVAFGDAGLCASLVREAEEPEPRDYHAVFTAQQLLVAAVVGCGLLAARAVSGPLGRGGDLAPLLPAALAALAITSLQTVATARLERSLRFDKLAVAEIIQALAFNATAVACASAGMGVGALAVALVARSAAGALAVFAVEPWKPAWVLDWPRVRRRLGFGLPFQAATFVNLMREALLPVAVGAMFGAAAVGGVFWAAMFAGAPVIFAYMLQRVLLPMLARLQNDVRALRRACEVSLFAIAALVVPAQTTLWALQEPATRIVFGAQWIQWLPVYRLLWISFVLEPQLLVAIALLNALGRAGRTLGYVAALCAAAWVGGLPLLAAFGPAGYGVAAISLLAIKQRMVAEAGSAVNVRWLAVLVPVWAAAVAGGGAAYAAALWLHPQGLSGLILAAAAAAPAYLAVLAFTARNSGRGAIEWLLREWRRA